jgi:hypothetical protein
MLLTGQLQPSESINKLVLMKNSSDTSFLPRPQAIQASHSEANPGGHLFLGHKVLGELRILMRLSSTPSAGEAESKGPDGQSF